MSYLEFRQELTFGCPRDYEAFSDPLDELLEQIHGANRHVGRTPTGRAQKDSREPRLRVLKRELEEAVEREDFETAAELRDQINQLEHQSAGDAEQ
jgi:protein arginine kinase activator